MISKTRKTKSRRKNPEDIAKTWNKFLLEKDKIKKRQLAQSLKRDLAEDSARYWQIMREHVNFRKETINDLIQKALILPNKRSNPVKTMFRDTEVVIKHRGNKIIFDEEDADVIKNLIRKQYSDNDDVKEILK
jgi:hypothetical protein